MESRTPQETAGMGEVHSHISQPDKGLGMSGSYDNADSGDQGIADRAGSIANDARQRVGTMVDDAREQADEMVNRAQSRAQEVKHRAGEAVENAGHRASEAVDAAERKLDDRTGIVSMIRENPLPALGAALAIGYLLAGSRQDQRGRVTGMAASQLRGAIMGGLTAALTRELRQLVQEQGGSLGSMLGGDDNRQGGRSSSGARSEYEGSSGF